MMHLKRIVAYLLFILVLLAGIPYWARAAEDAGNSQPDLIAELQAAADGELRVSHHAETGLVRFLGTTREAAISQPALAARDVTPDAAARSFFDEYGSLFGITDPDRQLSVMTERTLDDGRSVVRYQQTHEGIPVLAGELMVQMTGANAVLSVNGEILPDIDLDTNASVAAASARDTALNYVAKVYGLDAAQLESDEPSLWIFSPRLMGGPGSDFNSLVWRLEVTSPDMLELREFVLVDAHLGAVTLNFNQVHMAKDRRTYDAGNTDTLPGTLRRSEGEGPFGDADVDNAHDFAGDTYDFFLNEHGRDSLDDAGMTLISTTDYCNAGGCPLQNAFWNGQQMAYGDGFASADDVVGHELAHGVTNFSSNLFYYFQSGAINESLSDVWGEFVDLTNGEGDDSPGVRWLLGEDLPPSIGAIRNMANPPAFGDPDRIGSANYYCGELDIGGVHWNSGVNNKAAYLMVDGDTFNGKTVSGIGISKVADLYYEVQTNMLTSASTYADLYDALIQASIVLGYTPAERQTVQDALLAVEMNVQPCGRSEPAPICAPGETAAYVFFDDLENPGSGNWNTGIIQGANAWAYPQEPNSINFPITYAHSGVTHMWGYNYFSTSDSYIAMTQSYAVPADAYMHFYHDWNFEATLSNAFDGGVVEYSINGGTTWQDAGTLFSENGYPGAISNGFGNPLGGRDAFVAEGYGYTASRLDLSSLEGENVRFRFRIGTDNIIEDYGWFIDDISIYSCTNDVDPPEANIDPTTLTADLHVNQSLERTITIGNVGEAALEWTIGESVPFSIANESQDLVSACDTTTDLPWISASPTSGTVVGGESAAVAITFDATSLSTGNYSGVLCISTNDPVNQLLEVTTSLTVLNTAPIAGDDSYDAVAGNPLFIAAPGVLANDDDVDGDSLMALLVDEPDHGNLTLDNDGSFTYTPISSFTGSDSFTYRATDGNDTSELATVNLTVVETDSFMVYLPFITRIFGGPSAMEPGE